MIAPHLNLGWNLRERILPSLASIDDLDAELPRIREVYDTLVGRDLEFDLRQESPHPSNLCEDDAALELAYTFGGREQTGVRYSYEPTCPRGLLKNRYTLFRDRLLALMNRTSTGYDTGLLHRAFRTAVPRDFMQRSDVTVTIAAVHHYRDRPPRLKAYFSCDYQDPRQSRRRALDLVTLLEAPELFEQMRGFLRRFRPQGGVRMVGFDFEPDRPVAAKVYKTGDNLTAPGLLRLVAAAGGGAEAREGLAAFQDLFLDGRTDPALFDLVTAALRRRGPFGLKLYIRPVDHYGDGEALARLRRWYAHLGREQELRQVERGISTVAPLDLLDETRGFFNYISVDVGPSGITKTSAYFTPQVLLTHLARLDPDRLAVIASRR